MKITLWSILSGQLSGHLLLNVPATETLRKVLEAYCSHKGASVSDKYVIRSKENHILNLNKTLKQADIRDGDTLMIGLLGDEKQTFAFGSWYLVTFASFIIGIFGIGCVLWLSVQILPRPQKFGVVIDAGSSHSEVFVFSWDAEKKPLGTAEVKLVYNCFIPDGINNFASHVEDLQGYFEPCLSECAEHVPTSEQAKTPIYLGATAGMRILKKFDCDAAQNVLTTLQQILAVNSTFDIKSNNVKIISGHDEGISGWITVNYLTNKLKRQSEETASVVDVGGASLQVTSEISGLNRWEAQPIKLFNRTHKVLSKSFLCYGVEEAQHRYWFYLLNPNKTKEDLTITSKSYSDPCLAKGFTHQIFMQELRRPCTLTDDDSQPLNLLQSSVNSSILKRIHGPKKYKAKEVTLNEELLKDVNNTRSEGGDSKSGIYFTVHGSSDSVKCEDRVDLLFERQRCESTFKFGDCMSLHSVPLRNGTLYAYSPIFHHVMDSLGMGPDTSLSLFKGVVSALCSMDATTLSIMYPDLDEEVSKHLCFDGMYVYSLFTKGLGINNSTWSNVVFSNEIHDVEVVWPQGFMINKTSSLPSESHTTTFSPTVFALLLCFFTAFIITGILFLHHSFKIKRHSTSYQRCIADHIDQELQRFIQQ